MVELTRAPDLIVDTLVGEIVARESVVVSFPQGGRVAVVPVEEGDDVEGGAVLARMDSTQQEQARVAAEAGVATAMADYRQAQADLDRQEQLLARGATTPVARDAAVDAVNIAEGALVQARTALEQARKSLDDADLRAPAAATVTRRIVDPGEVVGAAQPVLELALGDDLDAVFDVPEALLAASEGTVSVGLELLGSDGATFVGHVRKVSPLVDQSTGTVRVTVGIENPPGPASYGDSVRGTVVRSGADRLVIPFTAMSATADGPAVWTVDPTDDTVSLHPVRVIRFETDLVVLEPGLEDGVLVVTDGAQLLYPGRTVAYEEPAR